MEGLGKNFPESSAEEDTAMDLAVYEARLNGEMPYEDSSDRVQLTASDTTSHVQAGSARSGQRSRGKLNSRHRAKHMVFLKLFVHRKQYEKFGQEINPKFPELIIQSLRAYRTHLKKLGTLTDYPSLIPIIRSHIPKPHLKNFLQGLKKGYSEFIWNFPGDYEEMFKSFNVMLSPSIAHQDPAQLCIEFKELLTDYFFSYADCSS